MQKHKLGKNGPEVSTVGLGCMGMSISYGEPNDPESVATIHRAIDLGVNLVVTSDAYGNGVNEELVAKALKGKRDKVLVATKFGNLAADEFTEKVLMLALEFLHEHPDKKLVRA
jgi:aryl-alcohol dehydrogenase-like predicted oxidoreductase